MKELINVQVKNNQQLVSARELHKNLDLKKKFSGWWEQNSRSFEYGVDYTWEPQSYHVQIGNGASRIEDDYFLTIDMAKELCMMSKTKRGKEVRKYFIQIEKNWNSPEQLVKRTLAILNDENIKLKFENKKLIGTNKQQADKINHDADDVLFSHAIRYSNHAIKIRELAAILTQNGFVIGQSIISQSMEPYQWATRPSEGTSELNMALRMVAHGQLP